MANTNEVKEYLACWFQLKKRVISNDGSQILLPNSVFGGNGYSKEFEKCWQLILSPDSGEWYLEKTEQTIAQLLQPSWEITSCARCSMPVAILNAGVSSHICPCHDLDSWPNTEIPTPHIPVNFQDKLQEICNRISSLQTLTEEHTD